MIFVAVLILSFVTRSSCYANSGAEAITFHSDNSKEGYFSSPNYPYSFQNKINRTYRFFGLHNERVQIIIDDFSLSKPEPNEICNKGNSYLSYKKDDGQVVYLCGPERPLPILSDTNRFFLEYRQPPERPPREREENLRGFNATYRFVTNFGVDSGNQTSDGCDFTYDSKYAKNGSFQSPNFNGYYPRDMECTYYFKGSEAYLKINFTHFNVPGTQDCTEVRGGDSVELMETVDRDPNYFYERHCGQRTSLNATVNGTSFFIVFKSSRALVNYSQYTTDRKFIGFHGLYEFTNDTSSNARRTTVSELNLPFLLTYLVVKTSFLLTVYSP